MSTYIFRFDIFSFLSFCPCFQSRQKKEGAIPAVFLVRPWQALQDTTEEDTHWGRILHVAGSCIEAFQVSPEPERCVERKVLNYFRPIIPQSPSFVHHKSTVNRRTTDTVAEYMPIQTQPKPLHLIPWQGQTLPLLHTARSTPESYAGNRVIGEKAFWLLVGRWESSVR